MLKSIRRILLGVGLVAGPAFAQYNQQAGRSVAQPESVVVETRDETGKVEKKVVVHEAPRDRDGNGDGAKYDLAINGAFEGQTVLVIDLAGAFSSDAAAALKEKGFASVRYSNVPTVEALKEALSKSNQFWITSSCDNQVHMSAAHHAAIKEFFDAGHGVYL